MGGITHAKDRLSKFVRQLVNIEEDIAHRNFIAAEIKLPGLLPVCDLEEHIKEALEIHIDQKKQHRSLTQAEKDTLIHKAERSPHILGQVVYTARAVLKAEENLDFEDHIPVFGGNNNARIGLFNNDENETADENVEIFQDIQIQIYPNPVSNDNVNIKYRLPENTIAKVEIYDITGHQLHHLILIEGIGNSEFDLSDFEKGLYIYFISINNKPYKIEKLIVE